MRCLLVCHVFWVLFVVISASTKLGAQVVTLSPSEPRWGATLKIVYNPAATGDHTPKFSERDEVSAVLYVYSGELAEVVPCELKRDGGKFVGQYVIPKQASSIELHFVSRRGYDRAATRRASVRDLSGVLAAGANVIQMFEGGPDGYLACFEREMSLHPDYLGGYRQKWFAATAFNRDGYKALIESDLKRIGKDPRQTSDIGLLYAQSFGHIAIGDEPASRADLERIAQLDPTSGLLYIALSSYEYQVYSQQIEGKGPEAVKAMKRRLIIQYPLTKLAREESHKLARDLTFPLETIEEICRAWILEEPEYSFPYQNLGNAYLKHGKKLDEAGPLLDKAIDLLLAGKLHRLRDVSGIMTAIMLPNAYHSRAEVAIELGELGVALGAAQAAKQLARQKRPHTDELLGKIWRTLHYRTRAEKAYLEALNNGSKVAEDEIERLYQQRNGSSDGFAKYFAKLQGTPVEEQNARPVAPSFDVEALDGRRLVLDKLRGHIVVLNFWNIGCAPCKVEMPGLNTLVEHYKDMGVKFISFAGDSATDLKSFLKKTPFDYDVVPAAHKVTAAYKVQGFPVHVIIDGEGRVAHRLIGGSKTRHEDLQVLIDRLLKFAPKREE